MFTRSKIHSFNNDKEYRKHKLEFVDIKDEDLPKDLQEQLNSPITKDDIDIVPERVVEYKVPTNKEAVYSSGYTVPASPNIPLFIRKRTWVDKLYDYLYENERVQKWPKVKKWIERRILKRINPNLIQ